MFNFNGIDHMNMKVKDLKESQGFYNKIFNFEVKE
jgi:catechol 2,3-dioxygenase-like lactoylglutathione lyase family enzyme